MRRSVLFLPFCRGGIAPPGGRRSVHFSILRVVGTSAAPWAAERASFYHSVEGDCRRTAGGGAYIFAFCGCWGLAPLGGQLNVHFCILRVVGTRAARRAAERTFLHFAGGGDSRRTAGGGAYFFFSILRLVGTGTMEGDDIRRWKVSETCETICFLLYKAGFSVRIGGTVYKAL